MNRNSLFLRMSLGMALVTAGASLSACTDVGKELGFGRRAPNEYTVISQAPLEIPPEYTLRPPTPGSARPQNKTGSTAARDVLHRQSETLGMGAGMADGISPSTSVILEQAGAEHADPDIRDVLMEEEIHARRQEEEKGVLDTLMPWRDKGDKDDVLNAREEKERLMKDRAEEE